jgi:hypothetical protein
MSHWSTGQGIEEMLLIPSTTRVLPNSPLMTALRDSRSGQRRDAVAEDADGDNEGPFSRGEHIRDGGFEAAGSGAGQNHQVLLRAEHRLHAGGQLAYKLGELRPAMVDHLAAARLEHRIRDRGRPGHSKVQRITPGERGTL